MRILIAPDKLKGSLTALEAAEAIARGVLRSIPGASIDIAPIADGGEGTAEAIRAACGGEWARVPVLGPLGREIPARYAWLPGGVAAIDMSEASGLWRLASGTLEPLLASTFGTGQLIADALRRGARKILVGLGGSATNDGGIGMAAALGYRFLNASGEPIEPVPAALPALRHIVPPAEGFSREVVVVGLCDVCNPLLGERGATCVFGPQKGADVAAVETLERALEQLADVVLADLGQDFRGTPGAGAAGGLGFGLLSFCRAELKPGFETVAEMFDLEARIAAADWTITGEGRLDLQTLEGKGPAGIAAIARRRGKPVAALAGIVVDDPRIVQAFDRIVAAKPLGMPIDEAIRHAGALMENAAALLAASF